MRRVESTGWRKIAVINVFWLITATVVLVGLVIAGSVAAGGVSKSLVFYTGKCRGADVYRLNTGLHLLLNVFSTAVLASSNFFIQILNAPTRAEVDAAHGKGLFMDIGVAALRNAYHVSRFKCRMWVLLLLSSVPMHLLFNAAVFEVDSRETGYFLAIADEGFAEGKPYLVPGASLSPARWGGAGGVGWSKTGGSDLDMYFDMDPPGSWSGWPTQAVQNITRLAAEAKGWTRLDKQTCADEYLACHGLQNYADLLVVVQSTDEWTRDSIWDFGTNASRFWRDRIPADQPNSLWYSTTCTMSTYPAQGGRIACSHSCWSVLGAKDEDGGGEPASGPVEGWTLDFFGGEPREQNGTPKWNESMYSGPGGPEDFGLRDGRDILPVQYCLAKPLTPSCGVGLSNLLLLCVTICTLLKTIAAAVVLWKLGGQHTLVTLGDAVASFIAQPDEKTAVSNYLVDAKVAKKNRIEALNQGRNEEKMTPTPWRTLARRGFSAVGSGTWVANGLVLGLGILACVIFVSLFPLPKGSAPVNLFQGERKKDTDLGTQYDAGGTLGLVVAVNAPQLGLSIWYMSYNGLLTRLQMAREWARFSTEYRPLRVTKPRGEQVSTYRLQLPYRYSVPLLVLSAIFHWLMSNAFYVFVGRGSYFVREDRYHPTLASDEILPSNSILSLRYSVGTVYVVLIMAIVMVAILLALAWRRLPGYMPVVGSVSVLISAACHVSPFLNVDPQLYGAEAKAESLESDGERFSPERGPGDGRDSEDAESSPMEPTHSIREKATQCLLRWGVVTMPDEWLAAHSFRDGDGDVKVEHLGFGTILDEVAAPIEGRFYD